MIERDPFCLRLGTFYFLKNEKMIMLVQVLERSTSYVVVSVKGTELQETTICHAEELGRINEVEEASFKRGDRACNYLFSLSPVTQLVLEAYED